MCSMGYVDTYRSPSGSQVFSFHIHNITKSIFLLLSYLTGEILLIYKECVHKLLVYLRNGV